MHNIEITHIVKTDSKSKTQLSVRNNVPFAVIWEKLMSKLKTNQQSFMKI